MKTDRSPVSASPLEWLRTVLRDPRTSPRAVPAAAAMVTLAPGRPSRKGGGFGCGHTTPCLCFVASVDSLAALVKGSRSTAKRAMHDLQELGYLHQVKRGHRAGERPRASVWRLVLPLPGDIPNGSPVSHWDDSQQVTGEPLEPVDNSVPTGHQRPIGKSPRGHQRPIGKVPNGSATPSQWVTHEPPRAVVNTRATSSYVSDLRTEGGAHVPNEEEDEIFDELTRLLALDDDAPDDADPWAIGGR